MVCGAAAKDENTPTHLATCWLSHHQPASHLQQCAPMWAHHVCIGPIQGSLSAAAPCSRRLSPPPPGCCYAAYGQKCTPKPWFLLACCKAKQSTPVHAPVLLLLSSLGAPRSLCLARCSLHHTMQEVVEVPPIPHWQEAIHCCGIISYAQQPFLLLLHLLPMAVLLEQGRCWACPDSLQHATNIHKLLASFLHWHVCMDPHPTGLPHCSQWRVCTCGCHHTSIHSFPAPMRGGSNHIRGHKPEPQSILP